MEKVNDTDPNATKNIAPLALSGGNPYENIRAGLEKLGIKTTGSERTKSEFGISLNKLTPVSIKIPQNLLAEKGDTFMWISEPPQMPIAEATPMELVQLASSEMNAASTNMPMLGACQIVLDGENSTELAAEMYANMYFRDYTNQEVDFREWGWVTLVQAPKNGGYYDDKYFADDGFRGLDTLILEIQQGDIKLQIKYFIFVSEYETPRAAWTECWNVAPPDSYGHWKISLIPSQTTDDSASWFRSTSLFTLLSGAQSVLSGFTDLSGSALAQTTGTGASAQITLDTDAAGHGWYIDYTPYLNEEYLPTSNPYEWIAQPGSAAEGKIDLLSVLWHELGHAYGLDHTTDSHDLMATTLQPGVRRLPSAEELALLSPLLADAGWLAYASTLSNSSSPHRSKG